MEKTNEKNGKSIRLLNPAEKGAKAAHELKTGNRYTNFGELKCDKNGEVMTLSNEQRAYRSGYLAARKDNAKAYVSKMKKSKKD